MTKSTTTLNRPFSGRPETSPEVQWTEARSVFPLYLALAKQLHAEVPFSQAKRNLPEKLEQPLFSQVHEWLESMDSRVQVHQLRHLLQMTTLNASESGLRALILRHVRKPKKSNIDRDKIDFLLVQYFALCAPAKIYHKQIELADVAQVLEPVLGEVSPAPLKWCEPLEEMIESLRGFRGLREILKTNFIEQGRNVKESAGGMFYDPAALISFIRFNFMLRRTLIELMHADLIAIRRGLGQLDAANVRTIDCRHFGLSAAEPIHKIREIAHEWKQPFQREYTERSVNQEFDKLLGLRTDVEEALERAFGKSQGSTRQANNEKVTPPGSPARKLGTESSAATGKQKASDPLANSGASRRETEAAAATDFESCMEQIWEQLIATPPSRGRSMTTLKIAGARILMSSWEVAAFVSEDGPSAEDLRRAVVSRVLVTGAMETAKENGNTVSLDRAIKIARVEVARLQERVDVAKQTKDTEAAVNLGISTKRLLSALDEAEKL